MDLQGNYLIMPAFNNVIVVTLFIYSTKSQSWKLFCFFQTLLYMLSTLWIWAITFCKWKGLCLPMYFLPHQVRIYYTAKFQVLSQSFTTQMYFFHFLNFVIVNSAFFFFFNVIHSYNTVQNLGHYLSGLFPLIYHHFLLCIRPVVFFFPLISVSWSPDREWNIRFVKRISLFKCLEMMG